MTTRVPCVRQRGIHSLLTLFKGKYVASHFGNLIMYTIVHPSLLVNRLKNPSNKGNIILYGLYAVSKNGILRRKNI